MPILRPHAASGGRGPRARRFRNILAYFPKNKEVTWQWPRPVQGHFVVLSLGLAMINMHTKLSRDLVIFEKIRDNISKTIQDNLVSIKFAYEVVCALSNGYVTDDLDGWPLIAFNHLHFYILRCLVHLRNCDRKNFKFDVQVECASHSLRTTNCPWWGVVRSCDPLKISWGSDHITGTAEPKLVKFCTQVGYINASNRMTSPTEAWLWFRDCFKILPFAVMQRVARVCQRQLSYLFYKEWACSTSLRFLLHWFWERTLGTCFVLPFLSSNHSVKALIEKQYF